MQMLWMAFAALIFLTFRTQEVTGAEGDAVTVESHLLPRCAGRNMIVSPANGMGLNNQVDILAHSIYIGILTNRSVCMRGFLANFDSQDFINIGWIFDIPHMNQLIQQIRGPLLSKIGKGREVRPMGPPLVVAPAHPQNYEQCTCLILTGEGASGHRRCPGQKHNIAIRNVEPNYTGVLPFLSRNDMGKIESVALTSGLPLLRHGMTRPQDDEWIHQIHLLVRFNPVLYDVAEVGVVLACCASDAASLARRTRRHNHPHTNTRAPTPYPFPPHASWTISAATTGTYIYVYMYICVYVYMCICIYVYMDICIYVYMYICVYVYMCIPYIYI
jgi:hypothetical protein